VVQTCVSRIQDGRRLPSWKNRNIAISLQWFDRSPWNLAWWRKLTLLTILTVNNNNNNRFTALCLGLPGWAGTGSTHPPTILSSNNLYQLLPSTTIHSILLVQITCCNLFAQPLFMSSLVFLLVWSPPPHIPYISSLNLCLLFAAHAYTIATYFSVVSVLYQIFLVFFSTPYLELCLLP